KDGGGRDPERTPMQWSAARNAGFSDAKSTWLPVAEGYEERNVSVQTRDKHSFLSLYRTLGRLRSRSAALKNGRLEMLGSANEHVLIYRRVQGRKSHVVIINFSDKPLDLVLPKDIKLGTLQVSSIADSKIKKDRDGNIHLHPYEAAVFVGK